MRHTDGRQLAPREPADRCSKASVTKSSASAERASPVLIVLGYDHQQKPCGAWFIGN
jgi:hypothetical protein